MQGTDIVQQLRDRAFSFKAPDPLMEAAADEIARLRLTDAEREAISFAAEMLCAWDDDSAAVMRGGIVKRFLERTK